MRNYIYLSIVTGLMLGGCSMIQVVEDTSVILPTELQSDTQLLRLKRPERELFGEIVDYQIDNYTITEQRVSELEAEERLIAKDFQRTGVIDFFLFDGAVSYLKKKYAINTARSFSFNLVQNQQQKVDAKCWMYALSEQTRQSDNSFGFKGHINSSSTEFSSRQKTELLCELAHEKKSWQLRLESSKEGPIALELKSETEAFAIKTIDRAVSFLSSNNGSETRELPRWASKDAGVELSYDGEVVAAYSFIGQQKVWLSSQLSIEHKELLLAMSQSLSILNWQDKQWNDRDYFQM
ncbi:hypothetical protein [Pseudoalteromonas obscura]|uniref:Lipoprotein n=1 Tax=Pseudoalteromonas obscura TaxID=3048491 RepID=A0ABT7EQ71_9GAMM|nr:hypothetical protein [Pseudoalteromonas sp. P94(2023)]MDK2597177.1 hypothetical protein [Pseudoalteromonas sp. P94(2023)]